MFPKSIADSLEDGLQALENGQTIDQFLKDHDGQARELRPLLARAQTIRMAYARPPESKGQFATKQLILSRFAEVQPLRLGSASPHALWALPARLSIGAATVAAAFLVMHVGGMVAYGVSDSIPGDPLYSVKLGTESAHLALMGDDGARTAALARAGSARTVDLTVAFEKGNRVDPSLVAGVLALTEDVLTRVRTESVSDGVASELVLLASRQEHLARYLLSTATGDQGATVPKQLRELSQRAYRLAGYFGRDGERNALVSDAEIELRPNTEPPDQKTSDQDALHRSEPSGSNNARDEVEPKHNAPPAAGGGSNQDAKTRSDPSNSNAAKGSNDGAAGGDGPNRDAETRSRPSRSNGTSSENGRSHGRPNSGGASW